MSETETNSHPPVTGAAELESIAAAGLTAAQVVEGANAANKAPASPDPIEARLQAVENALGTVQGIVGTVAPVIDQAAPAAASVVSRLEGLEGVVGDFAAFMARAEPVIAALLGELHPAS